MDKKRKAPERLHQDGGEGCRQYDAGSQTVGAGVQGLYKPIFEASGLAYGFINWAETIRAVKGYVPHVGGKAFLVPTHAGHGFDFRDDILVLVDGIPEEVHQCLRPFSAGDRNAAVCQGHDVGSLGYPAHRDHDLRPWPAV